eukprot:gnl/TRDRNA2_/TRDRNA2_87267_c0_seq1.p2 gnl/TRDRNA2_/TRDRNA2_87267_c0~~gnl/TRDRNA2_/TRDRNA2_87267_c0_seq1.p2  ORF type:complete len:107 (-),score=9.23 gnl/TRDRNA2_/TRDRNA2_87267_c0_seq1:75-395(-)
MVSEKETDPGCEAHGDEYTEPMGSPTGVTAPTDACPANHPLWRPRSSWASTPLVTASGQSFPDCQRRPRPMDDATAACSDAKQERAGGQMPRCASSETAQHIATFS